MPGTSPTCRRARRSAPTRRILAACPPESVRRRPGPAARPKPAAAVPSPTRLIDRLFGLYTVGAECRPACPPSPSHPASVAVSWRSMISTAGILHLDQADRPALMLSRERYAAPAPARPISVQQANPCRQRRSAPLPRRSASSASVSSRRSRDRFLSTSRSDSRRDAPPLRRRPAAASPPPSRRAGARRGLPRRATWAPRRNPRSSPNPHTEGGERFLRRGPRRRSRAASPRRIHSPRVLPSRRPRRRRCVRIGRDSPTRPLPPATASGARAAEGRRRRQCVVAGSASSSNGPSPSPSRPRHPAERPKSSGSRPTPGRAAPAGSVSGANGPSLPCRGDGRWRWPGAAAGLTAVVDPLTGVEFLHSACRLAMLGCPFGVVACCAAPFACCRSAAPFLVPRLLRPMAPALGSAAAAIGERPRALESRARSHVFFLACWSSGACWRAPSRY